MSRFEAGLAETHLESHGLLTVGAETFPEFVTVLQEHSTSHEKHRRMICAPMHDGHRCKDSALPRRWIGVDIDNVTPAQYLDYMSRAKATGCTFAWYRTSSFTPGCPKVRLIVPLTEPADRERHERLAEAWHRTVAPEGLARDYSADRIEQPLFLPIKGERITIVNAAGKAFAHDLAGIPSVEELRASRRSTKTSTGERITGNSASAYSLTPELTIDFERYGPLTIEHALAEEIPDNTRCGIPPVDGSRDSSGSYSCIWHVTERGTPYIVDPVDSVTYWPEDRAQALPEFGAQPVPASPVPAPVQNPFIVPELTLSALRSAKATPRVLVRDYLFADVRLLPGAGGTGKTTLAIWEAIRMAVGFEVWGHSTPEPVRTMIISKEDGAEQIMSRMLKMMEAMNLSDEHTSRCLQNVRIVDLSGSTLRLAITDPATQAIVPCVEFVALLAKAAESWRPDHVILDPIVSFGVSESRVNDNEQGLIDAGRSIRNALGCAVTFITHTGKSSAREGTQDAYSSRGGSALPDGARMVHVAVAVKADEGVALGEGESAVWLNIAKNTYAPLPGEPMLIVRNGWSFERRQVERKMSAEDWILDYLGERETATGGEMTKDAEAAGYAYATHTRARKRLVESERISKVALDGQGKSFSYRLVA